MQPSPMLIVFGQTLCPMYSPKKTAKIKLHYRLWFNVYWFKKKTMFMFTCCRDTIKTTKLKLRHGLTNINLKKAFLSSNDEEVKCCYLTRCPLHW